MNTKKRKAITLVILVLLLLGGYVYRNYIAPQTAADDALAASTTAETETEASDGLSLLTDGADDDAPPATESDAPAPEAPDAPEDAEEAAPPAIAEDGAYTSRDDVALYIHTYGCLPENFISKKEAEALGWPGGGLDDYAYGKCIGGSHYGNYEGLLPEKSGRRYTECDIDTMHRSSRGAKRIVFSNDGLIYYTDDHYGSFTLLFGEE